MNPAVLSAAQARADRLRSLLLEAAAPGSAGAPSEGPAGVVDVVRWLGALQGQDVRSLLWSLGVRLPGSTVTSLRAALEQHDVVRTWPMRGTLHLVPSCDARWMLELMAVRIARAEATRRAQLGVSERDADRAVDVLGAALAGARLTRAECVDRLAAAGLPVAGQAAYHLLGAACRRGVVAMAPEVGAEQTFVLLDDWAPGHRAPERDEALAEIALRFVRGHGPVRRLDLAGWTGLTLADVDRGLAACGDVLRRVAVDGVDMIAWEPALPGAGPDAGPGHDDVGHRALPGFDEFLLGYKDRSLQLDPADAPTIVPGGNGMFRSTLVRAGRVVGTWRRIGLRAGRPPAAGKRLMVVEATPFEALPARDRARFEEALAGWGAFLEVDGVDVRWPV